MFALCAIRPALALDTGDIVVASIKGEVHIAIRGADTRLRAGAVLELPATVRTGRDGAVELRQGATSISVGPETLLEFPALASAGGSIDRIVQPRGTAFYSVGKRGGRKLRIETPFLVGVVKGTQFSVVAQDHATNISLFEGLLEVRSADDSDVIDLHAGEIATRDRAATDISVLKMESGAKPPVPSAPAGKAPAPNQRSTGDVVGTPLNAGRGLGNKPAEIPRPVVTEGVNVDLGVAAVVDTTDTAVAVDRGTGQSEGAAAGVEVSTGNGAATVDLGVNVGGDVVGVDVGVGAGQAAVDVDLGVGEGQSDNSGPGSDNSNSGPGNSGNDNSGPGNSNDLAGVVDSPDIAVGLDTGTPQNDGSAASVDVSAGNGAATVDLGANAGVDNGVNVDVGVGVGNTQVNLGVDLGAVTDIDLGLGAESDNSGPGSDNSNSGSDNSGSGNSGSGNSGSGSDNSGPGNVVDNLLDSLTRRSGKK